MHSEFDKDLRYFENIQNFQRLQQRLKSYGFSYARLSSLLNELDPVYKVNKDVISRLKTRKDYWRDEKYQDQLIAMCGQMESKLKEFVPSNFIQEPNQDQLVSFVKRGIAEEFKTYQNVNRKEFSTNRLDKFFNHQGPAHRRIIDNIKQKVDNKWKLANPNVESKMKIKKIWVKEKYENIAIVESLEKWNLYWYEIFPEKKIYAYEEENQQSYVLKKNPISNEWLIEENNYSSKSKRIMPKTVSSARLELLSQLDRPEVIRKVFEHLEKNEIILGLTIIKEVLHKDVYRVDFRKRVLELENLCRHVLAEFNTNKINYEDYLERSIIIKNETCSILNLISRI